MPHQPHERQRQRDQRQQADRHRSSREQHRAPGGLHRAHDRLVGVVRARELLAEAVDDEQRVVDGDAEPDQLDQVRHVGRRGGEPGDPVHDAERTRDRAGGEQERHRHRHREAEHAQQHEQGDRQGDALPLRQVVREDRVEVVLGRPGARHVRVLDARRAHERGPHGGGGALGLGQIERRRDRRVGDMPPGGEQGGRPAAGDGPRRAVDGGLQARPERRRLNVGGLKDDRERAVRPVAEPALEDVPGLLGRGARHREGVGEQRREPRARKPSRDDHRRPEAEDGAAVTQNEACPAGHRATVATGRSSTRQLSWNVLTSCVHAESSPFAERWQRS